MTKGRFRGPSQRGQSGRDQSRGKGGRGRGKVLGKGGESELSCPFPHYLQS